MTNGDHRAMVFLRPFLVTAKEKEGKTMTKMNIIPAVLPDYQAELLTLIRSTLSPKSLKDRVTNYHPGDLAESFSRMEREDREKLYRILDIRELSDVFEHLDDASAYFSELTIRRKVDVLSAMEPDKAASLLRHLDRDQRNSLIDLLAADTRRDIALLESFDSDEIGSKMTTNFIEIQAGLSIREAMASLIRQAAENDNISTLYVVDADHTFCGAVDLKDLIIAREGASLEDIIAASYPYVYARELIEDCIERLKDYSEDSIPVLDNENKLLGVITAQDIVQVVDDELGDDYAKLAGLASEEELSEPIRQSVRKRLPWLVVLLGLGMLVSAVVGVFEGVVAQLTIVMCFQSLILDMAGNVGTQSLAVTIRVLMDEKLTRRQKWSLIWKECRIGLANGLILGLLSFAAVGAYLFALKGNALEFAFGVSGCIGAALVLAMVISSISGTVIPLFFKKINVDPAVASGPLITTINDLVAVIAYYGLAWLLLIQMMHLA